MPTLRKAGPAFSTQANLKAAVRDLPHLWIFDNNDLRNPYRLVAIFESGRLVKLRRPVPKWLTPRRGELLTQACGMEAGG